MWPQLAGIFFEEHLTCNGLPTMLKDSRNEQSYVVDRGMERRQGLENLPTLPDLPNLTASLAKTSPIGLNELTADLQLGGRIRCSFSDQCECELLFFAPIVQYKVAPFPSTIATSKTYNSKSIGSTALSTTPPFPIEQLPRHAIAHGRGLRSYCLLEPIAPSHVQHGIVL